MVGFCTVIGSRLSFSFWGVLVVRNTGTHFVIITFLQVDIKEIFMKTLYFCVFVIFNSVPIKFDCFILRQIHFNVQIGYILLCEFYFSTDFLDIRII